MQGHGETLDQSFVWKRSRVVTANGVRNSKVFLFFSRLLSFSEMVNCRHIYTRKPGRSPTRQYGVLRPFLTCAPSLDFFWVFQEDFSSWNSESTSSTGTNLLKYPPPTLCPEATRVKRSSPFRSTLNTGYITCYMFGHV